MAGKDSATRAQRTDAAPLRERLTRSRYDAVVVGAGPNGLAAAITLAQAGCATLLLEAADHIGGNCRSAELTLPGFVHDIGSAIYPLGIGSPFFRTLPLQQYGLEWIHPDAPLAHPFDDNAAVILERSVERTAEYLSRADGASYRRHISPLVPDWDQLCDLLCHPYRLPAHPFGLARFGLAAIRSARALADSWFVGSKAKGLFAGIAAHSMLPLEKSPSAAFALALGIAGHAVGWPLPRGGAGKITNALHAHFTRLGGETQTGAHITSLEELPPARFVFLDTSPRGLLRLAGNRLPQSYRRQLARFRYGPGAFKMDWALSGPVPWAAPECRRAATVHLGATFGEIAESERESLNGVCPTRPYILLAQPSLFDDTRAPAGKHTLWAYCHVPNNATCDMTERIENQIERFAPGFRKAILARHVTTPMDLERRNPNCVGGDIGGGMPDWSQLIGRPVLQPVPYQTPLPGVYLCSSSTPPGAGVHGMCGHWAATVALRLG